MVGGTTEVSSYNVLNYFTSIGPDSDLHRGANTQAEFDRQEAKIVAALAAIDADVFGLIEIENNDGLALDTLVAALNAGVGPGTYAAIDTGQLGTDGSRRVDLQARRGHAPSAPSRSSTRAWTRTSVRTTVPRWPRPSPRSAEASGSR